MSDAQRLEAVEQELLRMGDAVIAVLDKNMQLERDAFALRWRLEQLQKKFIAQRGVEHA